MFCLEPENKLKLYVSWKTSPRQMSSVFVGEVMAVERRPAILARLVGISFATQRRVTIHSDAQVLHRTAFGRYGSTSS